MDKATDFAIKKFVAVASVQTPGFISAFLFGSYAKNKQNHDSDIDIAIVIKNLKDSEKFDIQVNLMMLASQFDSRIEPHPISEQDFSSGNPFAHEIRRVGIEIVQE
jgi:predicted nucleotidyltransferase